MHSVTCKNKDSAFLPIIIISPDPYFKSIFNGLFVSNHLNLGSMQLLENLDYMQYFHVTCFCSGREKLVL